MNGLLAGLSPLRLTSFSLRFLCRLYGLGVCLAIASPAYADAQLSAGVWWVYQNALESDFSGPSSAFDEDLDATTGGGFADPALVIYADDDGSYEPWLFSAEMRIGTGSFTDPANNNSGDNLTMHKAWVAHDFDGAVLANSRVTIGKSQVPFGWKTENFWPGDLLQGGYGDQMDVGVKFTQERDRLSYALAYYHQDDWGEVSTDTVDDNGHWGSSTTYRKIKTAVINADYALTDQHTLGASYQNGRLQDLAALTAVERDDSGKHDAVDVHYYYVRGDWSFKYRYIQANRDFSEMTALLADCAGGCFSDDEVKTQRHVANIHYRKDRWNAYIEGSVASTKTRDNNAEDVHAYAPGVSYMYGPGSLYLEYLWQNGDINRYGDIYEADFRAVYASFDFYF